LSAIVTGRRPAEVAAAIAIAQRAPASRARRTATSTSGRMSIGGKRRDAASPGASTRAAGAPGTRSCRRAAASRGRRPHPDRLA
jgi:hypothetical protein